jgi:pyruvate kinase
LSRHAKTLNKTAIYRGVYPVAFNSKESSNESLDNDILKAVCKKADLNVGDKVIVTHGDLMETVGASNTLKILVIAKKHLS